MNNIPVLTPGKPSTPYQSIDLLIIKSGPFHELSVNRLLRREYAEEPHDLLLLLRKPRNVIQPPDSLLNGPVFIMHAANSDPAYRKEPLLLQFLPELFQRAKRPPRRLRQQLHKQCMALYGLRINDSYHVLQILPFFVAFIISVEHVNGRVFLEFFQYFMRDSLYLTPRCDHDVHIRAERIKPFQVFFDRVSRQVIQEQIQPTLDPLHLSKDRAISLLPANLLRNAKCITKR